MSMNPKIESFEESGKSQVQRPFILKSILAVQRSLLTMIKLKRQLLNLVEKFNIVENISKYIKYYIYI